MNILRSFRLTAATLAILAGIGSAQAEELTIYAWGGELPAEVTDAFAKETGITVTVDFFDGNETMMAKLEAGATGYDVIHPSQYAVQILAKKGLIEELDHAKIPNIGNIGEVYRNLSYDKGNKFQIPYLTGSTGFAYNTDCVKEELTSWKALWDEKYKGRIYMLDNMLAAYIAGLQLNGFDANSTNKDEIEKATQSLIEQKPLLAGYNSTSFADLVASGEACITLAWSGQIIQVIPQNPQVRYVIPDEGGTMWFDGFSVMKNAPNRDAAYKFLDYLLRPEVAAKMTQLTKIATCVDKARELLPSDIATNKAIFPPAEKLKNADFILDTGDAMKFYQDGWTKVKTAK